MRYKFIEGLTVADVAFEAYGKTLGELFENAALATMEVMIKLDTISGKIKKVIKLEDGNIENLLFRFLEELIFLKDADYMLFDKFKINIKENKKFVLKADIYGEKIDIKRHELKVDVKAVTWHKFQIKKDKRGWKARIILDI